LRLTKGESSVNIWNVYLPANRQQCQIVLDSLEHRPLYSFGKEINIVTGDFNFTENEADTLYPTTSCKNLAEKFEKYFKKPLQIEDFYKYACQKRENFSFFYRNGLQASRLDRAYVSKMIEDSIVKYEYRHAAKQFDHKCVNLFFNYKIFNQEHGRGFSKLFPEILSNHVFLKICTEKLTKFIANFVTGTVSDDEFLRNWDILKSSILCTSVEVQKSVNAAAKLTLSRQQSELDRLKTEFNADRFKDEIEMLQSSIKASELSHLRRALKGTFYEQKLLDISQIPSAKKEAKRNVLNRYIYSLKDDMGVSKFENKELIDIMLNRFNTLFNTESNSTNARNVIINQFLSLIDSKISQVQSRHLSEEIQLEEIRTALAGFQSNKSPGYDGIPVELYRHAKLKLYFEIIFCKLFDIIYRLERLSETMYVGVISLLYKEKGNRDLPNNWRPISLLNVDYKLFAKILTNRLQTVMPLLVGGEQFCSVKGRDLQKAVRVLDDTCFYAKTEQFPLILLSIDQQQAFDRVEWDFMFRVLEKMGLPSKFVNLLQAIYKVGKVNEKLT